jgi:hypothetical protein
MVLLRALYLHLGPFSRHVIGQIEQRLDELQYDAGERSGGTARRHAYGVRSPRNVSPLGQSRHSVQRRQQSIVALRKAHSMTSSAVASN